MDSPPWQESERLWVASMHRPITAAALAALCLSLAGGTASADAGVEFFEKKVRPVLAEHCYGCHSVAEKKQRGGLTLDTRAGLLKGGDTGPALVPGKPGES